MAALIMVTMWVVEYQYTPEEQGSTLPDVPLYTEIRNMSIPYLKKFSF